MSSGEFERRPTHALPRAELAPVGPASAVEDEDEDEDLEPAPDTRPAIAEARALARATEEDEETKVRCPCCLGAGMVSAEVSLVVEGMMVEMGERR